MEGMSTAHAPPAAWMTSAPWTDILNAPRAALARTSAALLRDLAAPETMAALAASPRLSGLAVLVCSRLAWRNRLKPALSPDGSIASLLRRLAPVLDDPLADVPGAMAILVASDRASSGSAIRHALSDLAADPRTASLAASLLLDRCTHPHGRLSTAKPDPDMASQLPMLYAQEFLMEVEGALIEGRPPVDWSRPQAAGGLPARVRAQADWLLALGLGFAATNYWDSPLVEGSPSHAHAVSAWLRGPAWADVLPEAVAMAATGSRDVVAAIREMPPDLHGNSRMARFEHVLASATSALQHRRIVAAPAHAARRRLA